MALPEATDWARRLLPPFLFSAFRRAATAFLTPILFSCQSGHFRSALAARPVDRRGAPLPGYTYPAIAFLQTKNFTYRAILEFGAGQSTLWWAERADRVIALEGNAAWYDRLCGRIRANVELHLVDTDLDAVDWLHDAGPFDVIVIDGLNRLAAARLALRLCTPDGAILFDNSDGHGGGEFPVLDLFRTYGFSRVDFYGYVPGGAAPHCTSLFFRGDCFLLVGDENTAIGQARLPVQRAAA